MKKININHLTHKVITITNNPRRVIYYKQNMTWTI